MEITADKLLQIIGTQYVELMMARQEIERLQKQWAEQQEKQPSHIRPVT